MVTWQNKGYFYHSDLKVVSTLCLATPTFDIGGAVWKSGVIYGDKTFR